MTKTRWERALLGLWALAFTSLARTQLPHTVLGDIAFTMALWSACYPLASTVGVPASHYWWMLAIGLPIVIGLEYGLGIAKLPYSEWITITILTMGFVATIIGWLKRRREQGEQIQSP